MRIKNINKPKYVAEFYKLCRAAEPDNFLVARLPDSLPNG